MKVCATKRCHTQGWVLPDWQYRWSCGGLLTAVSLLALPLLHAAASYTNPGYVELLEQEDDDGAKHDAVENAASKAEGERGWDCFCMLCRSFKGHC